MGHSKYFQVPRHPGGQGARKASASMGRPEQAGPIHQGAWALGRGSASSLLPVQGGRQSRKGNPIMPGFAVPSPNSILSPGSDCSKGIHSCSNQLSTSNFICPVMTLSTCGGTSTLIPRKEEMTFQKERTRGLGILKTKVSHSRGPKNGKSAEDPPFPTPSGLRHLCLLSAKGTRQNLKAAAHLTPEEPQRGLQALRSQASS